MAVALAVILLGSISMTAASTQPVREYLSRRQMRTFGEPSQLLGSDKDLVLLLVSEHMWRKDNWRCIKSKWVCTETANVSFTRDDHFWIPPHRTSNGTSEKKPGKLRFQYDVIRKPGEYTKVNTTYITESGNYSYGEYPVHFADDVCMVIAFPRRASYIFNKKLTTDCSRHHQNPRRDGQLVRELQGGVASRPWFVRLLWRVSSLFSR
ncbi:uncharacterized protein LOC119452947 isoform X2 [Dermacentor silvarum]|uniref:uncharacterized protein LOC119452947 isoform X2 n=1 Tax=Dermacentor silvarum TaxID=543639 RepID=UPI002101AADA|nr:uncharacterized protein LOC119452947 isoform X2 [Dermacentor silvarum]